EITTIFVVGFPDDIQEREFMNMFTFAPGFEGSMLKFPSTSEHEKKDSVSSTQDIDESGSDTHESDSSSTEPSVKEKSGKNKELDAEKKTSSIEKDKEGSPTSQKKQI
ncbi:hypothetical protein BB560_003323, partial [Smittium megazygosporum]